MKKLAKVLIGLIIVIILIAGVGFAAEQAGIETPISTLKNSAATAALDASGTKSKVESALRSNAAAISAKTGLSEDTVNDIIDNLDIQNWEVTTLPADATVSGTSTLEYNGTSATVTTYDDPSVVTINSGGVEVTLSVPESAQGYTSYLGLLG